MSVLDHIIVIALCMVVMAFLSGIEAGVTGIHRFRLRHLVRKGDQSAKILEDFLDNSDKLFGTTLVGTDLCTVVMSVLVTSMVKDIPGSWAEVSANAALTLLVLVFADYLPKAWFYSRPTERSRRYARMLQTFELILRPLSRFFVWLTKLLVPGASKSFGAAVPFVTKDDLMLLAREGEKHGVLSPGRRAMIQRALELSGKTAKDIMIPRAKMVTALTGSTVREFLDLARVSCHTRIPVFNREKNEFTGVANCMAVASSDPKNADNPITDFVRKPLFVPETMPADEILPLLRRSRHAMCLVVGEKSEVVGLLTTEDIVREVVGEPAA